MQIVGTKPEGVIIVPDESSMVLEGMNVLPIIERTERCGRLHRHAVGKVGLLYIEHAADIWPIFSREDRGPLRDYMRFNQHTGYYDLAPGTVIRLAGSRYETPIHDGVREI